MTLRMLERGKSVKAAVEPVMGAGAAGEGAAAVAVAAAD